MSELTHETAPRKLSDIPTPALVLDRRKLERNIAGMQARVPALGVAFRPHVKTCKSADIASLMLMEEPAGITVSTLGEADYFLGYGFRDITYAVGIAPGKLAAVGELMARGADMKILLDEPEAAQAVSEFGAARGLAFKTLIEIDSDGHRAGVRPGDAKLVEIGRILTQGKGSRLEGVLTHAGGSYGCRTVEEIAEIADRERAAIVSAAETLTDAELPCPTRSVGSTPTATFARTLDGVTELRAGVFCFHDLFQAGLGVCGLDDIAAAVLATVIGYRHASDQILIDAGALALSKDRSTAASPQDYGYGLVVRPGSNPASAELIVDSVFQEHGMLQSRNGAADPRDYPIGTRLLVLPNHACMTAAPYDRYHVLGEDGAITDLWPKLTGW